MANDIDMFCRLRVNQLIKNHALVEDRDLAHEIFLAKVVLNII